MNDAPASRTLVLSPQVELVLIDWTRCCDRTFEGRLGAFMEAIAFGADVEVLGHIYRPTSPFWVTVRDGIVERIEEQYLP